MQVPLAKPSIMLGVNQTIMMALGIVVIAAFVGAGGLGQTVLDGLQQLNVGEALNGGIAIVVMAIVLDRVTTAWSVRERQHTKPVRIGGRTLTRGQLAIGALLITVVAVVVGREVLRQQSFPEALGVLGRDARQRDRGMVAALPRRHHERRQRLRADLPARPHPDRCSSACPGG